MKKNTVSIVLIAAGVVCASSCKQNSPIDDIPGNDTLYAPVETKPANTDYKPAFTGQTRIAGVKTTTPYGGTVLLEQLDRPWGITSLPDGRLLITEKGGTLRIATSNGQLSARIQGLPTVKDEGQGGLLGITVDPDFGSNKMVYWVFSEPLPEGNITSVAKGKLSADEKSIEQATVIYRATPAYNGTLHYGGRIIFDKSGYLFVSTGERSDLATRPQAQDLNSGLGKIVRITKDGQPAPGNPFAGQNRPEIYSYGHRNVQGLTLHPGTGDLWETEFGPRGGDEVNRVEASKNYGWPTITYGIEYAGGKVGQGIQQQAGMEQPVYYWDPVVSPSGICFYTGSDVPEWKNNLFAACLSGLHVARLVIRDNKVTGEERLLADEGQRFRDITMGKDGNLYAVTDNGRLYKIHRK
ncbi:PQQ-dependent sugar dehydrogenase [Filimonas effusa]|uniref:PQQ-dependent sugar dehydrogenase n=1 Tax=Filimonas effusa TaxID=2508721 RepID=A0A4Q1D666_9BACT|nr:PQQ-dependent sugar dehydrogenase [Filimonas effusa]RXK83147.1 PQQ-dependent sugar dehydrogenase [Filimonas effusa]